MDNNLFDDEDFVPIEPQKESSEKIVSIFDEDEPIEEPKKIDMNRYAKILPIVAFTFVLILGIYIFVNNVNADIVNLIKIEEKSKVGYINNSGNIIVKPKYLYGSDFYNGHAVVKNYNNLYGIIDSKGNDEISFGNIFSATLYDDRYIVSKFTNNGLKVGLLNSNLKEETRFIYDKLSYINSGLFMFTKNDVMGIMTKNGKEIYSYKVDDVDDRNISVEVSNIEGSDTKPLYAKVKVNSSSTIINISTGKEVFKYTLEDINVLDNNVFYIKKDEGNNSYFVIKNDKLIYETTAYKRIRIDNIDSNIAIGIKEDASIDYINLLNKNVINSEPTIKYTYSDGVVLEEEYNFANSKVEYTVFTPNKILGKFSDIKPCDNTYVNNYMKVITVNGKYKYIDKSGNFITNKEYEVVGDFNKNGYAVISNDNAYGVIDNKGREVISLDYDNIKFLDDDLFENVYKKTNEKLFIFMDNNKYGIINSKNKVVVNAIYDDLKLITTKYPILKATYDGEDILLNLQNYKDININSDGNIQIYDDYIVSNGDYYNYNGKLIYNMGGVQ